MKRVIWELEDGRKKYSVNANGPEIYSDKELSLLDLAIKQSGPFGYANNLKLFGVYDFLKKSFPDTIKIKGKIVEEANLPLTEGVIV